MNFEELQQKDISKLRNLQPDGWSNIVPEFEFYVNSPFCYSIKAEINNRIIGIGAAIIFVQTAWLAHIIVDPDHRRKGIGSKIVEVLLKYLDSRSVDTCLLIATEMGLPVYENAGFRIISDYTYLKKETSNQAVNVSDHIMPFTAEYADLIYKLDRAVTGENREWLLSGFLDGSYVFWENNMVKGYYLPNLREGLIIAKNAIAGIELLKLKIQSHEKIVLPSANKPAIEFLVNDGYVFLETKGIRMIRGRNITWYPNKIFSRIGGNFG